MSLLQKLADFASKEGKTLLNFAKGLVIQADNSPDLATATGQVKHNTVVEALSSAFKGTLAKFGELAHDVAAIFVHDAFATVKASTPELLKPVVAAAETAVEQKVDTILQKSPFAAAATPVVLPPAQASQPALGLGESSGAAPTPTTAPSNVLPLNPVAAASGSASPAGSQG